MEPLQKTSPADPCKNDQVIMKRTQASAAVALVTCQWQPQSANDGGVSQILLICVAMWACWHRSLRGHLLGLNSSHKVQTYMPQLPYSVMILGLRIHIIMHIICLWHISLWRRWSRIPSNGQWLTQLRALVIRTRRVLLLLLLLLLSISSLSFSLFLPLCVGYFYVFVCVFVLVGGWVQVYICA